MAETFAQTQLGIVPDLPAIVLATLRDRPKGRGQFITAQSFVEAAYYVAACDHAVHAVRLTDLMLMRMPGPRSLLRFVAAWQERAVTEIRQAFPECCCWSLPDEV